MGNGVFFKQRYQEKWRTSSLREHFVHDYLNWLLVKHGFILKFAGLGAGSAEYISRYYNNSIEALDFIIYSFGGRIVGFLDVTGYEDPRKAHTDSKRCIGSWKLYKAEKISRELGIKPRNIWYAHFTDSQHILVLINAERLKQLVISGKAEKRRLYEDEKISYCLELKHFVPPRRFIEMLLQGSNT